MNDALDDILAESGDEEEEESIVNQVLDEIGIEISGKVRERDTEPPEKECTWLRENSVRPSLALA